MGTALADKFNLAYFFTSVVFVYVLGGWLTSDTLGNKRTTGVLYLPSGHLAPPKTAEFRCWQIIPSLLVLTLFVGCLWWIRGLQIDKELESLNGWLYPANEHVNLPCQGKHNVDDELVVMSGNSGFVVNNFPHTVLAWKCEPIMTVDRDANGSVGITLTILDQDGKVVVALSKGHFDVNRNNYFKIDRHGSRSTLSVIDQHNQEVLYLHMANRNTLQLRAILYYRGLQIQIDEKHPFGNDDRVRFGGSTCIVGSFRLGPCLVP